MCLFLGFLQIGHSVQFRSFSINPKLNIFAYLESTRRDDQIGGWPVDGGGRTRPHAPPRALKTTARDGHAPDLPQRLADVSMTQSVDRPGQTDSARSVFDPVQLVDADVDDDVYADVGADVGDDVDHDVISDPVFDPTRSMTRPGHRPDPDIDPTRSPTRPGQRSTPGPVNARPGQR